MKKILVVALALFTSSAMAAHGPAGCGLGALLFAEKEGLVMNVVAATFNGTSGNQTFGMSTGTLGCEDAKTARVAGVSYVEANVVALSNDISRGEGETLTSYLSLIKKEGADVSKLQENFEVIFAKGNTPALIHESIITLL